MPENISDKLLIERCTRCDNLAWSILIDRYINLIYNAVYNTVTKHTNKVIRYDIEDVCQDIFLKLIANKCKILGKYDSKKASFSTWITIVSRNAAIDYIRSRKNITISNFQNIETIHAQYYLDPDKIDIPKGVLSPRQRLVLRMMYDDGLDVESVATYLDVKRQTIRSLHHRALKKLRVFYGLPATRGVLGKTATENEREVLHGRNPIR